MKASKTIAFSVAVVAIVSFGCGPSKEELAALARRDSAKHDFKTHIAEIKLAAQSGYEGEKVDARFVQSHLQNDDLGILAIDLKTKGRNGTASGCNAALISWEASQADLPTNYSNIFWQIRVLTTRINDGLDAEGNHLQGTGDQQCQSRWLILADKCDEILRQP